MAHVFSHDQLVQRQKEYSERIWWRKVAHVRVVRRQRTRQRTREGNIHFLVTLPVTRPNLLKLYSAIEPL